MTRCIAFSALLRQLLYPILMFAMVFRTLLVRVRPNVLLVFKPYDNDDVPNSGGVFAPVHAVELPRYQGRRFVRIVLI